jgi:hypothetical protein
MIRHGASWGVSARQAMLALVLIPFPRLITSLLSIQGDGNEMLL